MQRSNDTLSYLVKKLRPVSWYLMSALFFIGNLKFFKMMFFYVGVKKSQANTGIALVLCALLAGVLLLCFFETWRQKKNYGMVIVLLALCLLYALPDLFCRGWYEWLQYGLFVVPFALTAYLMTSEENGFSRFFDAASNISQFMVFLFGAYIIALFFYRGEWNQVLEFQYMSYGDISFVALFFLYADLGKFFCRGNKQRIFPAVRIFVYEAAILYACTRNVILCMVFAFVVQFILHYNSLVKQKWYETVLSLVAVIIVALLCVSIVPAGSRMKVMDDGIFYEVGGKLSSRGQKDMPASDETAPARNDLVYSVIEQTEVDIESAARHYVVAGELPLSEMGALLWQDLKSGAGEYLIAPEGWRDSLVDEDHLDMPEEWKDERAYTRLFGGRVFLWKTALAEFAKHPLAGNGLLYYQTKYEIYPHNAALELLCDFGILGLLCFLFVSAVLFVSSVTIVQKTKDDAGQILGLIITYIPMHLLYTSLYGNKIMLFSFAVMLLISLRHWSDRRILCKVLPAK